MRYVYLLRTTSGQYKVGVADNATRRAANIQTSNPDRVDLIACKLVDNALAVESSIHAYLSGAQAQGGTEWFALSPEQALDVCVMIHKVPDIPELVERTDIKRELKAIRKSQEALERRLLDAPKTSPPAPRAVVEAKPKQPQITDEYLSAKAIEVAKAEGGLSTSLLQRRLRIGYGRASRIIDSLESIGVLGSLNGAHPRELLL